MKKLLFNGCSFVAGDEIVWDQYCKESGKILNWVDAGKSKENFDFWHNYRHVYRLQYALPAMVARHFSCLHIDISQDGNSNDMIALATVNYLLGLDPEDRKNYHVCIGWTTVSRLMKYSKFAQSYVNLHIQHIDQARDNPYVKELEKYIYAAILESHNEDFFMNFVKNVMLLENFLIANGITYTFYKSLGTPNDSLYNNFPSLSPPYVSSLETDRVTNHDNWLKFNDKYLPYQGDSWTSTILKQNVELLVSSTNGHPNLKAASDFSLMIRDKIISQNIVFN